MSSFFFNDLRAKKFNSVAKWIGMIGGAIGLIISAFMIQKESSKKAAISTTPPTMNSGKIDDAGKVLGSIKYLDDKTADVLKKDEEK